MFGPENLFIYVYSVDVVYLGDFLVTFPLDRNFPSCFFPLS